MNRSQDPKIKLTKRGVYFIRPWVDVIKGGNLTREKQTFKLGKEKRKAVTEKARIMQTINQGRMVAQAQTTLNKLLVEYQKHIDKLAYTTRQKYEGHIGRYIQPTFGEFQLCEITTKVLQDWFDGLPSLSWNTKTDIRNVISGIFTKADEWGYWKEKNPTEKIFVGRKQLVREKRKLTVQQTQDLLAELDPMPRIICMVSLFATLRISEILGLQEKHLDFDRELVQVRQRFYRGDLDRTKTDKSNRDVSMGGLVEYLRSICTGDPERFVFQSHESCHSDTNLRARHLVPAAKRLNIYYTGFGFHSLRREAITEIGKVIGAQAIMNMAGHTKMDLTMLYSLTDLDEQRAGQKQFMSKILPS